MLSRQPYPDLKIMEAFMYRHHPQWQKAKQLVLKRAKSGNCRTIQTFFSYYHADPNNIRNVAAVGGGGILDSAAIASPCPGGYLVRSQSAW